MPCEFLEVCPAALGRCVREGWKPGPDCAERLICAYLESNPPRTSVLYLCDQKQCDDCSAPFEECFHTSDITHAKNFEDLTDRLYFERGDRVVLDQKGWDSGGEYPGEQGVQGAGAGADEAAQSEAES